MNRDFFAALLFAAGLTVTAHGSHSVFSHRPDDPRAVCVGDAGAPAKGDGVADDTAVIQAAIDRVQETTRRGIVFIPEGRYRLTRELQVWSGIRLIGFGANRPVFLLGPDTPGYENGPGQYLVHFVSDRPASPEQPVRDANPGTFYSAMSNIDIEIGPGNAAAVGVRSHYAQHCFLSHLEFRTGSGRAGIEEVGNEAEDLHFIGGEFGITTHKPSPSWPFLLIDSSFTGQRRAAIETEEGGLTLIRDRFADLPTAILVRPDRAEELWMEDCRLERISGPALAIDGESNARTEINVRNTFGSQAPIFASFRESGRQVAAPGTNYLVNDFSQGLQVTDFAAVPAVGTKNDLVALPELPAPIASDIVPLPPMDDWVNVRSLGAKGDGVADDTDALRSAIAQHRVIYLPSGRYRVTETLTLRPDTVLIGLNPITTQISITDYTAAFQGVNGPTEKPAPSQGRQRAWFTPPPFPGRGSPKPMIEAPPGGTNIINGIGLDCGGINNRAVALKWSAGERSLVNDVRFLGGHGTYGPDGQWLAIYNDTRTGDADPQRRWDSQFWSLWVTGGGGGVFKDIWTPDTFAAAGMYVSDTSTRGRVYALSSEHHVRNEVKLRHVSGWGIYDLQTEEERGESPLALPLEISDCRDLTIANFFIYRVDLPVPGATGILVTNSHDLHFRGLHAYSPGKLTFDNTFLDQTSGVNVRSREIARLDWTGDAVKKPLRPASPTLAEGAKVASVASGFANIDGLVADRSGGVIFTDETRNRVFHFSPKQGLALATDSIPQPAALALDHAGNLMVISHHGNVYAWKLGSSERDIAVLAPETAAVRPDATAWLPINRWRDDHDWLEANTRREPVHYVSPDGSVFIPAPESYAMLAKPGRRRESGTIDIMRTYALAPAEKSHPFYVSDEFGQTTWRFTVGPDGTLADPQLFAQEGEAGTAVDADGNVYVCAGQVFVYNPAGVFLGVIEVPERPSALAFGGPGGRALFIAARTSLYAIEVRSRGR